MRSISLGPSIACAVALASCAAQPGPAPVEPESSTPQASVTPEVPVEKKNRNEIVVGIDPIKTGFNPHLVSDDSAFVQSLARLVLPSAFVDGQMNTDVLLSAAEIPSASGVAQTVQYRINPAAQWSDGSPITGADFRYLWENNSTQPGIIDAAGYQAISDVRSSEGGKLVTVEFKHKVADWRSLFSNLLPSHLFSVGSVPFDKVLATEVPASAGRYMVRSIDRRRGVVELARNDRFWGAAPASVELLTFRESGNVSQTIEMLRNGQLSFAHLTPSETSGAALSLATGVQSRTVDRDAQLTATFNTRTLKDPKLRAALTSVIDVHLVAVLAAGRTADLSVADPIKTEGVDVAAAVASQERPIRVAVDPTDEAARGAGRAIVDMLSRAGFKAELIQSDLKDILENRLPDGEADMVLTWQRSNLDAISAASAIACDGTQPLASNISGFCSEEWAAYAQQALAGEHDPAAVREHMKTLENQYLAIPIMTDRRIDILGRGIVTGEKDLAHWPVEPQSSVLATAHTWKDG